ncbi:MAG: cytochrome c1, partial [Alphaproteobacteria bacterium]
MRKISSVFTAALAGLVLTFGAANPALAAGGGAALEKQHWSFDGMTGSFDKKQLARGFEVFKEVCAACHGLNYVAFRNFVDMGFTEDEVKAIIADKGYEVLGEPDDEGEVAMRAARLSDYWPNPFANAKAAAAANNGKAPPDLSLMAKARPNGPDYIYNLLTRYM